MVKTRIESSNVDRNGHQEKQKKHKNRFKTTKKHLAKTSLKWAQTPMCCVNYTNRFNSNWSSLCTNVWFAWFSKRHLQQSFEWSAFVITWLFFGKFYGNCKKIRFFDLTHFCAQMLFLLNIT